MDDAPSTNTNWIYDYEDVGWVENRSKRLHDPLLMANVKGGKKKKDGASSSKTPQKKGVENLLLKFLVLHYLRLVISWRQERTKVKQLYRLGGMPYALNVWVYECASDVKEEIVAKEGDYIPRTLNWQVVGVKPKFEMFMASIFTENASNIQPTGEDLILLGLLDNLVVSHFEHSLSADKPTQDLSNEILGFEDFSFKPPD
ncbi:hypothetical protein H5410_027466 [Solanum commersonii]|uniref:Ulp1-like peptidase n=1 Tax=Solanum commersonii TaxID=4109 RepID=A0A9J5Z4J0_SOLCO|nr:hypothetical protein H5410_027466 [Solanum commersonii]